MFLALKSARHSSPSSLVPESLADDDFRWAEPYRRVYVSLDLPARADRAVIGVTSAIRGEGRTTVAIGLARTLAQDLDVPVTLIEVDLSRPALAAHAGLPCGPGLSEVARGECALAEVMHPVADNLAVVTAGDAGPDPACLLHDIALHDPFHSAPELGGVVILDLPPIITHSYSPLVAALADAVVLVVWAGGTPINVAREAILRLGDRPPQGVVFNAPRSSLPRWWPGRRADLMVGAL